MLIEKIWRVDGKDFGSYADASGYALEKGRVSEKLVQKLATLNPGVLGVLMKEVKRRQRADQKEKWLRARAWLATEPLVLRRPGTKPDWSAA